MKTAQTEAFRELVDEIRKNAFLKDQLVSLIVFGSFIRGDIIEKQSALDIYGVFNKMSKETISKLTELIEKHVKIKYRVLDFARAQLIDDEQAIEIYTAYLEGIELDYPHEYWADFIKSRLKLFVS